MFNVFDHQSAIVVFLLLGVFPQKSYEIFSGLKIDEKDLLEDVGLQLFFVTKIRLISYSTLSHDQAVSCGWLRVSHVVRLGLLKDPCLFVAVLESICSEQLLVLVACFETVHPDKL